MRLAGTHLLCKGETESQSYANSESDTNRNPLTDADAVTNAHADAETKG
jgi:hypothetical protein